jgi:sec-independent protein translocase protein TatA
MRCAVGPGIGTSAGRGVIVGDIGWQELLIIFVILLLLFGATRLPALSKSLGQSIRGFRQALKDEEPEAAESGVKATPPVPADSDAQAALSTSADPGAEKTEDCAEKPEGGEHSAQA